MGALGGELNLLFDSAGPGFASLLVHCHISAGPERLGWGAAGRSPSAAGGVSRVETFAPRLLLARNENPAARATSYMQLFWNLLAQNKADEDANDREHTERS